MKLNSILNPWKQKISFIEKQERMKKCILKPLVRHQMQQATMVGKKVNKMSFILTTRKWQNVTFRSLGGKKWVHSRFIWKLETNLSYGTTLEVLDFEIWFINFESLWRSSGWGWRSTIIGKNSSTTILTKKVPNLEKLNIRLGDFACVMLSWHVKNP